MRDYFIRRFLLIPPTLFGLTLIVFGITRFVPGGPMDRVLMEMQTISSEGSGASQQMALSDEQIEQMKAYYGLDKPWYQAYFLWLGKVVRGDLGKSTRYGDPVVDMIRERLPISTYFGFMTLLVVYSISLPLGVIKATKHRTHLDNLSSVAIFVGYAIPGYVLGAILLLYFCFRLEWFPMGGFVDDDFAEFTLWGKVVDLARHTTLPLACYVINEFAFVTMMMKNHLMDNLASDYIRTAVAKGVSFKEAVRKHALRNSLIPIATSFGHRVTLFVSGSFLIERVFDIDGFGLLGFTALTERDYPVVMGVLLLSALLVLLGNILADVLVALVDPRVRFK